MKIIKHSPYFEQTDSKPYIGYCMCGCVVEVDRTEIIETVLNIGITPVTLYCVKCPECRLTIQINDVRL